MIEEIMRTVNNFFEIKGSAVLDTFNITDGSITTTALQDGQYFKLKGSVFNDGVHQYPTDCLTDETFTGYLIPLAVPKGFIDLCYEVEEWMEKYGTVDSAAMSPFNSESFGGYSYTKASGQSQTANSTWKDVFKGRLNQYRRL